MQESPWTRVGSTRTISVALIFFISLVADTVCQNGAEINFTRSQTASVDINGVDVYSITTFWSFKSKFGFHYIDDSKAECIQEPHQNIRLNNLIKTDIGLLHSLPFITIDSQNFLQSRNNFGIISVKCSISYGTVVATERFNITLSISSYFAGPAVPINSRLFADGRLPIVLYDSYSINEPEPTCTAKNFKCVTSNATSETRSVLLPRHPGEELGTLMAVSPDMILLQSHSNMIGYLNITKFTSFLLTEEESPHHPGYTKAQMLQGDHVEFIYLQTITINTDIGSGYFLHCMVNRKRDYTSLILQAPGKKIWDWSFIRLGYIVWRCDVDSMPFGSKDVAYYLSCIDETRTKLYAYRLRFTPLGLQHIQNDTSLVLESTITSGLFLDLVDPARAAFLPNYPETKPINWENATITGRAKSTSVSRDWNVSLSIYIPALDLTAIVFCVKNVSSGTPFGKSLGGAYSLAAAYRGHRSLIYSLDDMQFFFDEVTGLYSSTYSPVDKVFYGDQTTLTNSSLVKVIPLEPVLLLMLVRELKNGSTAITAHKLDKERRVPGRTYFRRVLPVRLRDVSAVVINQTGVRIFMLHEQDENSQLSQHFHLITHFDLHLDHPKVTMLPFYPKPVGFSDNLFIRLNKGFTFQIKASSYIDESGELKLDPRSGCASYETQGDSILLPLSTFLQPKGHLARWGVREYPVAQLFDNRPGGFSAVNLLKTTSARTVPRSDCLMITKVSSKIWACITETIMIHVFTEAPDGQIQNLTSIDLGKTSQILDLGVVARVDPAKVHIVLFKNMITVVWHVMKPNTIFTMLPRIGFFQLDRPEVGFTASQKAFELNGNIGIDPTYCLDCPSKVVIDPEERFILHLIPEKSNLWVCRYLAPSNKVPFYANLILTDYFSIINGFTRQLALLRSYDCTCNEVGCLIGAFDSTGSWYFKFIVPYDLDINPSKTRYLAGLGYLPTPTSETPPASRIFENDNTISNSQDCPRYLGKWTLFRGKIAYMSIESTLKVAEYCIYADMPSADKQTEQSVLRIERYGSVLDFYNIPSYSLPALIKFRSFRCLNNYLILMTEPAHDADYFQTIYFFELGNYHVVQEFEMPYQEQLEFSIITRENLIMIVVYDASTQLLQEYTISKPMLQITQPELFLPTQLLLSFHGSRDFTFAAQLKQAVFEVTQSPDKQQLCLRYIKQLENPN